ncbi:MAG: Na(+)/H(+) antiporter subunit B [Desulfurococcaceae archaeon]
MKSVELLVVVTLVLAVALLITLAYNYLMPSEWLRTLAVFYLYTTFNPQEQYTAYSPEGVTAIVWDYRGLDTLFETAVFYLALISGLSLARGLFSERLGQGQEGVGLSVIVKTVTKITAPMILAVGASIAFHGHLTPGGGFQGGATIAVVPLVLIVIFSTGYLLKQGITTNKMLALRSIGLTGIGITAVSAFLVGLASGSFGYVFQNMPKPNAPAGLPNYIGDVLISGTLWFFNLFEMLAVAAGFTMVFIILLLLKWGE